MGSGSGLILENWAQSAWALPRQIAQPLCLWASCSEAQSLPSLASPMLLCPGLIPQAESPGENSRLPPQAAPVTGPMWGQDWGVEQGQRM